MHEDDEPEIMRSPILGPDGGPIFYELESEKQGFIGFTSPETYEHIREAQERLRRKRYARARKP